MKVRLFERAGVLPWALYDWANSAFATTVLAAFFPIFFQRYWGAGEDPATTTFRLGMASAAASVIVAASAPFLGAIADRAGAKKRFLLVFCALGVVMTGGLFFVKEGAWAAAAALFVVATVGFAGGNVFYDALLGAVSRDENVDKVSAFGFSLGYLGGGVLLGVNALMVNEPSMFGLADKSEAVRWSFLTVAVWWAVFATPLFLRVREPEATAEATSIGAAVRAGYAQLVGTLKKVRALKQAGLFLVAYWFYIDGVDTVIRMATDYGSRLGLDAGAMITALLVTQLVGFPAALAYGFLGARFGVKRAILAGVVAYVGITLYGAFVDSTADFFGLAICVGLVQGGVQSLSRSLYTRLIPPGQAGEFFGFYNMLGKFAAVLGPLLIGAVSLVVEGPRAPLASIVVLFIVGGGLLLRVDEEAGQAAARAYDDAPPVG